MNTSALVVSGRRFVGLLSVVAATLAGAAVPSYAQYVGDGQTVAAWARVAGDTANAWISSAEVVLPSSGGSPSPAGVNAFNDSLVLVDTPLSSLDTTLWVHAEALTAQTTGANLRVDSSAGVASLPEVPGTGLNVGVSLLGAANVSLIRADAVRTETYATASSVGSRTIFTGLTITNLGGVALVGTDGRLYSNLNITFENNDPTVGVSVAGVADILLHEKVDNVDNSRTTNAIRVNLLSDGPLGSFADSGVMVARSTAGLNAVVAAPEPGALGLLAVGGVGMAAMIVRRRNK